MRLCCLAFLVTALLEGAVLAGQVVNEIDEREFYYKAKAAAEERKAKAKVIDDRERAEYEQAMKDATSIGERWKLFIAWQNRTPAMARIDMNKRADAKFYAETASTGGKQFLGGMLGQSADQYRRSEQIINEMVDTAGFDKAMQAQQAAGALKRVQEGKPQDLDRTQVMLVLKDEERAKEKRDASKARAAAAAGGIGAWFGFNKQPAEAAAVVDVADDRTTNGKGGLLTPSTAAKVAVSSGAVVTAVLFAAAKVFFLNNNNNDEPDEFLPPRPRKNPNVAEAKRRKAPPPPPTDDLFDAPPEKPQQAAPKVVVNEEPVVNLMAKTAAEEQEPTTAAKEEQPEPPKEEPTAASVVEEEEVAPAAVVEEETNTQAPAATQTPVEEEEEEAESSSSAPAPAPAPLSSVEEEEDSAAAETPPPTPATTPAPASSSSNATVDGTEVAADLASARRPAKNVGMSPEAARRLAETRIKEEVLGRVEGRYKLLGKPIPLGTQAKSADELETLLAELRAEPPAFDGAPKAEAKTTTPTTSIKGGAIASSPKKPLNYADVESLSTNFAAAASRKNKPRRKGLFGRMLSPFAGRKRQVTSRALVVVDNANFTFFPYKQTTAPEYQKGPSTFVAKQPKKFSNGAPAAPPLRAAAVEVNRPATSFAAKAKAKNATDAPEVTADDEPRGPFPVKATPPPPDDISVAPRIFSKQGATTTNFKQAAANRPRF